MRNQKGERYYSASAVNLFIRAQRDPEDIRKNTEMMASHKGNHVDQREVRCS